MLRLSVLAAVSFAIAGASAAQEAPIAAPYEVRFGIDRESFDESGITALSLATRDIVEGGAGTITVDGHADTLADAAYNEELSRRRARVIRSELIARGARPETVRIAVFGETQLAVETGDGVAESANRRVTIAVSDFGAFEAPDPLRPYSFPLP